MCYEKKNGDLCGMIADLRQLVRDWQKVPVPVQSSTAKSDWVCNHSKVQTSALFSSLFEKIKRALQNKGVCHVFVQEVSGFAGSIPWYLKGFSSLGAKSFWDLLAAMAALANASPCLCHLILLSAFPPVVFWWWCWPNYFLTLISGCFPSFCFLFPEKLCKYCRTISNRDDIYSCASQQNMISLWRTL